MKPWKVIGVSVLIAGALHAAPTRVEMESACRDAEAQEQAQEGLPKTDPSDYLVPLMNATFGSAWCKCRNVGTSPHIGQDYYDSKKPNYSLAVSNGTVKSIRFIQGCGWEVMFEDSAGARWRFLHANKPSYAAGQQMWRGEILGVHQSYPSSDCGTGPHLHLERRVAGEHGGAYTQETCQRGRKDCFYDPVTLFRTKTNVRTEAERKKIVEESKGGKVQELPRISTQCPSCSPQQPQPVEVPAVVSGEKSDGPAELVQAATLSPARRGRETLAWSATPLFGNLENATNTCISGRDCVTQIEFHYHDNQGRWKRLFADASVRNAPLKLSADASYCWPSDATDEYRVVVRTLNGRKWTQSGMVRRLP